MKDREGNISRDVIYADLDDEVTVLITRIRKSRYKAVVLVVPIQAQILQSLVSLKILRYKIEAVGKDLTIVTSDTAGRFLATEAGLATAERVELKGKKVKLDRWKPIARAEIDEVIEKGHSRKKIGRKILKITEVAKLAKESLKKLSPSEIPFARPTENFKGLWARLAGGVVVEGEEGASTRFIVRTPSRGLLAFLLGAAVILLFFIIYIAVPTATIYVTPRADPLSRVVNVTLTDRPTTGPREPKDANIIPAEFFDFTFSRDVRIGATGQIFKGKNAHGKITIYNRTPKNKFIVPSRFLSVRDQLVYHTTRAITIPQAIGDTPGSVDVGVVACEKKDLKCDCINAADSCEGDFVGATGNIDPAYFVMPAIPSLSPALYWAESTEPMTGGVTKITRFITKDDLTNVKETVALEVIGLAREELTNLVQQKNRLENQNLVLLANRKALKVEIISLTKPQDLAGSLQDDFTVSVTARVQGLAYEKDDLRALLLKELETKVHPEKRLTKIDFDNAMIQIETMDLTERRVKLAVSIQGIEEYDLSELTNEGARLVSKIRSRILGKRVVEAESYIRNLPEVNNAAISSWPFWARTVPELVENVKFKIKK